MKEKTKTIYIYLLEEGTDVWRPVMAEEIGNQQFRIVSKNIDTGNEKWQFTTGDMVKCEVRQLSGVSQKECLVAVEKIKNPT